MKARLVYPLAMTATLAAALTTLTAAPAAAAPTFGSPVTVVRAGCNFETVSSDAVASPSRASARGFVSFSGGSCPGTFFEGRLHYFSGRGGTWRHAATPYSGRVMAVTADDTGVYTLFARSTGVYLGKRTTAGTFAPAVQLSTRGITGGPLPEGDLVALAGGYWAVWTEQVGPQSEFTQTDLFQAKTLGAGHCVDAIPRQRITAVSRNDSSPSLTLVPATSGRSGARMVWSRHDGARGESGWTMYARAGCEGTWTSQRLAATGLNLAPDMTRAGATDHLAWQADDRLVHATISPTAYRATRFATPPAQGPRIAVSGPDTLVLFRSNGRLAARVRSDSVWTLRYLSAAGLQQQVVAATGHGSGAFTAFGASFSTDRLYAVSVS